MTLLVDPPMPTQIENYLNVALQGKRLQITADVDLEGLDELKEILGHYEAILKRLASRKSKLEHA